MKIVFMLVLIVFNLNASYQTEYKAIDCNKLVLYEINELIDEVDYNRIKVDYKNDIYKFSFIYKGHEACVNLINSISIGLALSYMTENSKIRNNKVNTENFIISSRGKTIQCFNQCLNYLKYGKTLNNYRK